MQPATDLSDAELNLAIVKRLGWKQQGSSKWWNSPDGMCSEIPSYATDLNAAWGLVPDGWCINIETGEVEVDVVLFTDSPISDWGVRQSSPGHSPAAAARAICLAFLDLHDQQRGGNG